MQLCIVLVCSCVTHVIDAIAYKTSEITHVNISRYNHTAQFLATQCTYTHNSCTYRCSPQNTDIKTFLWPGSCNQQNSLLAYFDYSILVNFCLGYSNFTVMHCSVFGQDYIWKYKITIINCWTWVTIKILI